jgi:hypothetical protein
MRSLRRANLLLAFMIELGMLAAFCYAGWAIPHVLWLRIVLAVGLPAIAIVLWGIWAAPKAGKRRLKMPVLLWFKIGMFAAAAVALWLTGEAFIASIFAVLAAVNLAVAQLFRQY